MDTNPIRIGSIVLCPLCGRVCRGVALLCALRLAVFGVFWHVVTLSRAAFHVFGSHHPDFCYVLCVSCADAFPMKEHFVHGLLTTRQEGFCLGSFVLLDTVVVAAVLAVLAECVRPGTFIVRAIATEVSPQVMPIEGVWPPPPTRHSAD